MTKFEHAGSEVAFERHMGMSFVKLGRISWGNDSSFKATHHPYWPVGVTVSGKVCCQAKAISHSLIWKLTGNWYQKRYIPILFIQAVFELIVIKLDLQSVGSQNSHLRA